MLSNIYRNPSRRAGLIGLFGFVAIAVTAEVASAQLLELAAVLRLAGLHLGPLDQLLALGFCTNFMMRLLSDATGPSSAAGSPMVGAGRSSGHQRRRELEPAAGRHDAVTSQVAGKLLENGRSPPSKHAAGRVLDPAWAAGLWWSPPPESNRRPHPYHGCALPTELGGQDGAFALAVSLSVRLPPV